MAKCICFIDGFNLYHAIARFPSYNRYKWLDLSTLPLCYLTKKDKLAAVYYFTALCPWDQKKRQRHKDYITALKSKNIHPILGNFKKVRKKCRAQCQQTFNTYEEKETDVNIAIYLLKLANLNQYEKALVISADTDLIPAIKMARELFDVSVELIPPIGHHYKNIQKSCNKVHKMKRIHLETNILEKKITLKNGHIITCPIKWQ